ncbi:MAG: TatD family hydrolase [bacterium]|nr:TatD family hydrolase [bacterium]
MIDSHCHLDFKQFEQNRSEAIENAHAAGVESIINIGTDLESSKFSVNLARANAGVYAAVGVHPHDASTVTDTLLAQIGELASDPKVVAIGEIGLDYYRDRSPRDIQRKAFRAQLNLAVESQLPIVIHTRESFDDTVEIVREYASSLRGGVFHCFPGDAAQAEAVFDLGFHVSFGGIITFPKANMARTASQVPIDKIILETDAPFLTPVPHRGKTNYPEYVKHVYRKLAELKEMPAAEVEKRVDRNCQKLFGLVDTFGG